MLLAVGRARGTEAARGCAGSGDSCPGARTRDGSDVVLQQSHGVPPFALFWVPQGISNLMEWKRGVRRVRCHAGLIHGEQCAGSMLMDSQHENWKHAVDALWSAHTLDHVKAQPAVWVITPSLILAADNHRRGLPY